jgi:hypothetical protein
MFMRWRWGGSGLPDAGCRVRHMLCAERSGVGWPCDSALYFHAPCVGSDVV